MLLDSYTQRLTKKASEAVFAGMEKLSTRHVLAPIHHAQSITQNCPYASFCIAPCLFFHTLQFPSYLPFDCFPETQRHINLSGTVAMVRLWRPGNVA